MALFGFQRRRGASQPRPDWPWVLTVNGMPAGTFEWRDILRELRGLRPDADSFLILEQNNPQNDKEYWFLQTALNLAGECAGWYTVECGFSTPEGPVLLHRDVPELAEAAAVFKRAFQDGELEVAQFQGGGAP